MYADNDVEGPAEVDEAEGWVPIDVLPMKENRGSWDSSSNLC